MIDPMPAVYDALNWPAELRPKPQPKPHTIAARSNIDWPTEIETRLCK